ncbi:MAG: trypsin-like serine protease [Alphaproteobacteria bacterium]|nr:trypsin-like serine protease [Alphaproteobacteria bacterium]
MYRTLLHSVGVTLLSASLLLPTALAAGPDPDAAIARLNHAGHRTIRHCTAVLTGPNRALTAAHCIDGIPYRHVHLLRGYERGAWLEHMQPDGLVADDPAKDIVTLCLGRDDERPFVPVSRRPVNVGETVTILGYGRPRVQLLNRASCRITAIRPDDSFVVDCPMAKGNSGAPVLRAVDAGYEVVGIVSGTTSESALIYAPDAAVECAGEG